MTERLERDCSQCSEGQYEMAGRCSNCHTDFTLSIPRGHDAPGHTYTAWDCPNCGTHSVRALSAYELASTPEPSEPPSEPKEVVDAD